MARMVNCVKMGREMEGLDEPPFDGPLGQRIYDNVSKLAWEQWQEHMKMLLNEYRLQPWKKEHQEFIVQQMEAYFFGEGAEKPKDYVPPSSISRQCAGRRCSCQRIAFLHGSWPTHWQLTTDHDCGA